MSGHKFTITLQGSDGATTVIGFYTIRALRNWLREHSPANIVRVWDVENNRQIQH